MKERIYPAGPGYDEFKKKVARLTGLDLDIYKFQIHRRIHTLMNNWGLSGYEEYFSVISKDPEKKKEFLNYITINVTEFFRNPPRWKVMKEEVFPELRKIEGGSLNFWSAGCSTGEEPYSLAMLARESGVPCKILAVDLDDGALEKATRGTYREAQLVNIPADIRKMSFSSSEKGFYDILPEVKRMITFRKANLLKSDFPKNQHLILCRNVVIYFSAETKKMLYEKFFESLADGGFLVVGTTEQIFEYSRIGFEQEGSFLYRKPLRKKQFPAGSANLDSQLRRWGQ